MCEAGSTHCGEPTKLIGYDTSEVLDREPAKVVHAGDETPKTCVREISEVRMAELAPRIVEKGLASDRVVIETVVAKVYDPLPLYRQEARAQSGCWTLPARRWTVG